MSEEKDKEKEEPATKDIFRNPAVRYLAYAEEIGRGIGTFGPCSLMKYASYFPMITHTYILTDAATKAYAAYKDSKDDKGEKEEKVDDKSKKKPEEKEEKKDEGGSKPTPIVAFVDRYGWHMLASIAIPKYTLSQVNCGLGVLSDFLKLCKPARTYFAAALALAAIPIIIKPIDILSDHIMDSSFRKIYGGDDKK